MSRIHEALLKAQMDGAIQKDGLEEMESRVEEPQPVVPLREDVMPSVPDTLIDQRKSDTERPDIRKFRLCEWLPQKTRLAFLTEPPSAGVEQFRILRSRLIRERSHRHLKTVLITGAASGAGKTFVAANLALALARNQGSRILLVDGDLRRSNLHALLGLDAAPGLADYLTSGASESEFVRQTPEPNLCVITAGKPCLTPTELLHTRRMQRFIESMSRFFDWILVDSPPAAMVSDSSVLCDLADGVLLVLSPGIAVKTAQRALKEFGNKPLLGVVLNRATAGAQDYQYYDTTSRSRKAKSAGKT